MLYVGVTDFMLPEQVRAMRQVLDGLDSPFALGVGVMMSRKTLRGEPTKWRDAFPMVYDVRRIFLPDPGLFNVIHYADFDGLSQMEELHDAADWAGENVHAIQLDMIWPSIPLLKEFKKSYLVWRKRDIKIIIQANAIALQECDDKPLRVVEKLRDYVSLGLADYVLLDKSHGRGVPMNAEELLPYVDAIANRLPQLGIVVAGGLGPQSIHLVRPIIKRFPRVSIDAQGKLRPSGSALDPLDFNYVSRYLMRACGLYRMLE